MVFHRAAAVAAQIEVGMVGEIHHRALLRRRLVGDGELIVDQAIGDLHPDSAGKTLLTVGRGVGEGDRVFLAGKFPQFLVEALDSAVKAVFPFVGRDAVRPAVDGEPCPADAVGAAADGSAKAASSVR